MGEQQSLFATVADDAQEADEALPIIVAGPGCYRDSATGLVVDPSLPAGQMMGVAGHRFVTQDEARKLARGSDPSSSHEAAREHVRSGAQAVQKAAVLGALKAAAGLVTSAELAQAAGLDRYMVARRLPDLSRDGKAAQDTERPCRVTGRKAVTWRIR